MFLKSVLKYESMNPQSECLAALGVVNTTDCVSVLTPHSVPKYFVYRKSSEKNKRYYWNTVRNLTVAQKTSTAIFTYM
jgi:hypothetical protein